LRKFGFQFGPSGLLLRGQVLGVAEGVEVADHLRDVVEQ
jgi:hypothetical protein